MKNFFKISLLAIVLGAGFTSCTAESLDEENTVNEIVVTDPDKDQPKPPTNPNGG